MPKAPYGFEWGIRSKRFLAKNPVCLSCEAMGKATPATCVVHVVPHRNDMSKFFDTRNWAALCATCRNARSA